MSVAVIGSHGQLGSELCRQLGDRVRPLNRAALDLTDRRQVLACLADLRPTLVINAAAYTAVDRAEQESVLCFATNATGVAHLIEACRQIGCPLVQFSTDYVFGADAARQTPYCEMDPPGPINVYGHTKLLGEQYAADYERHFIIRTCGLFGPSPVAAGESNFVASMLRLAGQRQPIRVVGDQQCTPSFVGHVAQASLFLAGTTAYGTYHIVNQGATTWYEFACEIFRQRGIHVEIERIDSREYPALAARPRYSLLDTTKYHALGGPRMSHWAQGLVDYFHMTQD